MPTTLSDAFWAIWVVVIVPSALAAPVSVLGEELMTRCSGCDSLLEAAVPTERCCTSMKSGEKTLAADAAFLEQLLAHLSDGKNARTLPIEEENEQALFDDLHLMSAKPIIYAANLSEDDLLAGIEANPYYPVVQKIAAGEGAGCMNLPTFTGFEVNGKMLFPALFITIACGAVSGFHSLVSSGTSSKTVRNEKDMLMVGYGAMAHQTNAWYLPAGQDARVPYLHPIAAPCIGLPQTLLLTAEYDFLYAECEEYTRRLLVAGVPVRHIRYGGIFHGTFDRLGYAPQVEDMLLCAAQAMVGLTALVSASLAQQAAASLKFWPGLPELPAFVPVLVAMPGISGIDAIDLLRSRGARTRFIINTAYDEFDYVQRALALKIDAYILKPEKRETTVATIQKLCAQIDETRANAQSQRQIRELFTRIQPVMESEIMVSQTASQKRSNVGSSSCSSGWASR